MNRLGWGALALTVMALPFPARAVPILRWAPAAAWVAPGGEATLSIILDDTLTVRTVEVFIEYDPALVTSVSGEPGSLFDGFGVFEGFEEVDPQIPGLWHGYCVILGANQWTTGPGELFRWVVRGDAEGICGITANAVTLLPPGGGSYPEATLLPAMLTVRDNLSSTPPETVGAAPMRAQPNPFNPATSIRFDLPDAGPVRLDVFDVAGRLVRTLVDSSLPRGRHEVAWDGRDSTGRAVGSGCYLARLESGGRAETLRMALVQ